MGRRFTEHQVSDIIKRATEHQLRRRSSPGSMQNGISEDELIQVANELGIDSDDLERALSESVTVVGEDTGTLKSIKRTVVRRIDRELSDDDVAIVLEEMPPTQSTGLSTIQIGRSVQYKSILGSDFCTVVVSRRRGTTELRFKTNAGMGAVPFVLAIGISIIGASFGFAEPGGSVPWSLLIPVILISLGTWSLSHFIPRINQKIQDSVDATVSRIVEQLDDSHLDSRGISNGSSLSLDNGIQTRIQD